MRAEFSDCGVVDVETDILGAAAEVTITCARPELVVRDGRGAAAARQAVRRYGDMAGIHDAGIWAVNV
eukprot:4196194-Karenia_brevis.AAC.1